MYSVSVSPTEGKEFYMMTFCLSVFDREVYFCIELLFGRTVQAVRLEKSN